MEDFGKQEERGDRLCWVINEGGRRRRFFKKHTAGMPHTSTPSYLFVRTCRYQVASNNTILAAAEGTNLDYLCSSSSAAAAAVVYY